MAPGSTGRTGGEGLQGRGRPADGDRPRSPAPDARPPRAAQRIDPRDERIDQSGYRESGREVPRPRPPQDRRPAPGGSAPGGYRDDYATPPRPQRPQPRRDPRDDRDPREIRDPRDIRDPRGPRGDRDPRDPREERGPRRPVPPSRLPRGIDIIASTGVGTDTRDDFDDFDDFDDDPDRDEDDERSGGRRKHSSRGGRGRRRIDKRTPAQRRRRKIIRRVVLGLVAFYLLLTGYSIEQALTAPGNSSATARLAEWGRSHSLGWAVTWLENEQYKTSPPKTGGTLSQSDLQQLQQLQKPSATPSLATGEKILPPIKPFLTDPVAGEGVWSPAVVVNGVPLVQVAKLRSDPTHTSYLSAVAWIDQKHSKFALHPGSQEPGGTNWGVPDHITPDEMPGLIATWNGAFRVSNDDAKGGFYLNGKTVKTLTNGQASEVFMKDGSITIGQWGRDVSMTPDVVGVRQNLGLLVDNGQVNPTVDSTDKNLWGITVSNKFFVWRSGVGVTADGNVVYAMGPTLSVRTLAELLQRAGAVRAMELDINMEWVSFMTYTPGPDPNNPVPTKLLPEFKRTGTRYFSTDERDFVAVYAR